MTPATSLAGTSAPFVKQVKIIGNNLIDPYDLSDYMDLGNGLSMTPAMMDLLVSELKANYHYHGYPYVEAYSTLKVKNGTLTIKVDEKDEYRWGRPRAERAVLKKAFLYGIPLTDSKKQEIIEILLKGYQKQKKVEELTTKFLVKIQRERVESILAMKKAAMRDKIFDQVKEFQTIMNNLNTQEAQRIEEMRHRIQSAGLRKYDDSAAGTTQLVSDEYTDLDEFLDNIMFEEMLNPGL